MEALSFLKFWRPQNRKIPNSITDLEEGDDSFFDLEISMGSFDFPVEKPTKSELACFSRPAISMSPADHFSKRKIMPFEPNSKPQSPIALLKSAPRFRVFGFKKSPGSVAESEKSEMSVLAGIPEKTPKHEKQGSPSIQIFSRRISSRKTGDFSRNLKTEDVPGNDSSNRFSGDVIQKYLSKLKPKKETDKSKISGEMWNQSTASSPAMSFFSKEKQGRNIPAGIRGVCKHLGKSRSASATASPIITRRDDSLLLQDDGIQSAIQHCKRSFASSRDSESSSLSNDSSIEKLSNVSGSSMLSRDSSDSGFEKLR